jgi:hypothetical protein
MLEDEYVEEKAKVFHIFFPLSEEILYEQVLHYQVGIIQKTSDSINQKLKIIKIHK